MLGKALAPLNCHGIAEPELLLCGVRGVCARAADVGGYFIAILATAPPLQLRQLQQNLSPLPAFVGSDVIISSGDRDHLLLGRALQDLESEHNSRRDLSKILDLTTDVGLALKRKIHWKASVDEGAPNAIPSNDRLVGLKMVARDERPCVILVDVGDMVVDQHPTICR